MFISLLFLFMFSKQINNIFSIPIKLLDNDYEMLNFNNFIKTKYKNKFFNTEIVNYDHKNNMFGHKTNVLLHGQQSYCYYDVPNKTNIANLICGLRHNRILNIKLPAI